MPRSYDACLAALSGEGMPPEHARRACSLAFWSEHGLSPSAADERGMDPECDLAPRARRCAVALSAEDEQDVVHLQALSGPEEIRTFAEADFPAAGEYPRLLREAVLLRPGTFNGYGFTREALEEMVREFDPADPPPIQLDHSESAKDTHGYILALRLNDEDELRALLEFRGDEACTKVTDGRWRKLSAGIYTKPAHKVREGSVTPFPAVNGPNGARILRGGEPMSDKTKTPAPAPPAPREEAKGLLAKLAELLGLASEPEKPAPPATPPTTSPSPPAPASPEALAEKTPAETAVLAAYEERVAKLEQRLADQDKVLRLKEDTEIVASLMEAGKLAPAVKDAALAYVQTLTAEQREAWRKLQEASPALVEFGRRSKPSPAVAPGDEGSREKEVASLREAANKVRAKKPEPAKA